MELQDSPKKNRKKKSAAGGGDSEKEHKKPWQETYATPAEIKAFLSDHIYLRYNMVKYRVEARLPPEDPFCCNSELAQFVCDDFQPMSDRLKNTLLIALQGVKDTRKSDFDTVLESGFVPGFHPFLHYLSRLPPWDGQDYIRELSVSVMVKGGIEKQMPFHVDSIDNPRDHPFNYEGIYAQAYALYRQGFRHYFSKAEEEVLREHNKTFEMPQPEQEAISMHFRQPREDEKGEFYSATEILGRIGCNPALRMTIEKMGSAMKALGFRQYRSHGRRGYRVVVYKPEEIEMNRLMLANDARPDDEEGDGGDT